MRALLVPAIALTMSVSSMALAQGQQGGSQQAPTSGSQQAQQSGAQQGSGQQMSTRSYEEVETSLREAGFEDVRTLNAAYLVSAVSKDGEQVTFVVDPPAAGAAGGTGAAQGDASADQTRLRNQQQIRDDLTQAGFTNVQILDAAYLAAGTTRSGDEITMMIDPSTSTGTTGSGGSQPMTGQGGSSPQQGGQSQ